MMAATVNMGHGSSIPILSSEYPIPLRYPVEYSNDGNHIHRLHKRSPINPFKIAKAGLIGGATCVVPALCPILFPTVGIPSIIKLGVLAGLTG